MRVAVVEPLASGGLIHYAYQLCNAMAKQGVDTVLITAQDYELSDLPHRCRVERLLRLWPQHDAAKARTAETAVLKRWGLRLLHQMRRVVRGARLVREWIRLTRYLLAARPDIVQFGKINFPFERFFLHWMSRRGLLLTDVCHEFELREQAGSLTGKLAADLYRRVFDDFRLVFLHAEENRRKFLAYTGLPPGRTHVIPHGNQQLFLDLSGQKADVAEVRRRYHIEADEAVVLFFGNLTPSKGLPELVSAFAEVPADRAARLLIAGYPTKFMDLPALQGQAEVLGLGSRVIFDLRYVPLREVAGLMAIARVVVFPYRSSSQSGSLQVAYSFGRPVIATDVGGLSEAVEEGKSGFLVQQGSIQELRQAMQTLIEDAILAERMGAYAKRLSETRFSWDAISDQVVGRYEGLLQGGEGASVPAGRHS
jgi:glycosyltransferase involved in cell wall biosynthesis